MRLVLLPRCSADSFYQYPHTKVPGESFFLCIVADSDRREVKLLLVAPTNPTAVLGLLLGGVLLLLYGIRVVTDGMQRVAGARLRRATMALARRPLTAFGNRVNVQSDCADRTREAGCRSPGAGRFAP